MKVLSRDVMMLLMFLLVTMAGRVSAQSHRAAPFEDSSTLSDQEKRGKHIFLQRCSFCHLAKYTKESEWSEPAAYPPMQPPLAGLLKGASADKEKGVREFILKGSEKMPGYQYGLEPRDMDDLIAYMKNL